MLEQILYLITGVTAGLLAGLLGVGGGIVVVPILNLLFVNQFSSTLTMHIAIGSSLAVMMFTALSSAYAYYRRGLIVWPLFYKFIPGLLLGMAVGAVITMRVSSHSLQIAFAIFMMIVAINMFFSKTVTAQRELPSFKSMTFFAFLTGICSGLFGVGGGTLMVPFFFTAMLRCIKRQVHLLSVDCRLLSWAQSVLFLQAWKKRAALLCPQGQQAIFTGQL